ncbi:MAG: nuclear transport factor 2 family protein [Gammaproteobacteria bacterium]|nr:nuclear transport factor 2 family protein [Gammaproteobacteria bacterium]
MNHNKANKQAVELLLKKINDVWTRGNPEELEKYFHSNMVIEGPAFQDRIVGRDLCVHHHEDFLRNNRILSFKESDHKVNVWNDTAVASFFFKITFETEGHVRQESGHELYAFTRETKDWHAVWNSIVPASSSPTS